MSTYQLTACHNSYQIYQDTHGLKRNKFQDQNKETCKKLRPLDNTIQNCFQAKNLPTKKAETRNERERKRVRNINKEFSNLQRTLVNSNIFSALSEENLSADDKENNSSNSLQNRGNHLRNLSKVKTLKYALTYIQYLTDLLENRTINDSFRYNTDADLNSNCYLDNVDFNNENLFY